MNPEEAAHYEPPHLDDGSTVFANSTCFISGAALRVKTFAIKHHQQL